MQKLEPNPPHVLTPRDVDLNRPDVREVVRHWPRPSKCRICGGTGTFRWYAPNSRDLASAQDWECDCVEQTILHWWFAVRGVPMDLQRLSWVDMVSVRPPVIDWVVRVMDDPQTMISSGAVSIITGSAGSGKSAVATLLLKGLMRQGRSGMFIRAIPLFDGMMNWDHPEELTDLEQRLLAAEVLVVDDLGRERNKIEHVREIMGSLLTKRASYGLFTILTSRQTEESLYDKYGSSLADLARGVEHPSDVGEADAVKWNTAFRDERMAGLSRPIVFG